MRVEYDREAGSLRGYRGEPIADTHHASESSDKELVWERHFQNVERLEHVEDLGCSDREYFRYRGDGSVLRSSCLESTVALLVDENAEEVEGSSAKSLVLLSGFDGSLIGSFGFTGSQRPYSVRIGHNQVAVLSENVRDRRVELRLIEFFAEAKNVDKLGPLKALLPEPIRPLPKPGSSMVTLAVYDSSFALDRTAIHDFAFTETEYCVTPKTLVFTSSEQPVLYQIPAKLLSARRPTAGQPDFEPSGSSGALNVDTDVPPYHPVLPLEPVAFLESTPTPTDVLQCFPGFRESQTVCRVGNQSPVHLFPARAYDMLPDDFSFGQTIMTMVIMLGGLLAIVLKLRQNQGCISKGLKRKK